MLLKRWQSNMETVSSTHSTWAIPQALTHCGTTSDGNLWDTEQKCSGGSVTIHSQLLCRCGESQQRWNQWLWVASWSWASSPAGSVWLHTGFHRCLSQGRSTGYTSHKAHFKRPKHRNNSAETRQLQKKLQIGGPELFFICSGRVSKPRSAWLSCSISALILAPSEQRASGASSAVISHLWSSSKGCHKFSW